MSTTTSCQEGPKKSRSSKMSKPPVAPRNDFFQTETQVVVSVYVRNCKQDNVQLDVDEQSLTLTIASDDDQAVPSHQLVIAPLYGRISKENSGVLVLSSKVEVSLQKLEPGVRWPALAGGASAGTASALAEPSSAPKEPTPAAARQEKGATSRPMRSKWDTFKDDEEDGDGTDASQKNNGDGDIDSFFKQLYANADDDTRRAMMKSYQESGGTALSTNWAEVKKGKVETKAPEGMEARKW